MPAGEMRGIKMNDMADLLGIVWVSLSWLGSEIDGLFKFLTKPLALFEGLALAYYIYAMARSLEKTIMKGFEVMAISIDRLEDRLIAIEEKISEQRK
jgi:hypothetical protein